MGAEKYCDVLDSYAAKLIKYKARQLVRRPGFHASDREDLEQELVLDLLQRMPKYNPERAQPHTFIARIVDHRVSTIISERNSDALTCPFCMRNFSVSPKTGEDGSQEGMRAIDQNEYFDRLGYVSRPEFDLEELSHDVERVMDNLPSELRELCEYLSTDTIAQISRKTGISRWKIYRSIKRLREIFESAEIKNEKS